MDRTRLFLPQNSNYSSRRHSGPVVTEHFKLAWQPPPSNLFNTLFLLFVSGSFFTKIEHVAFKHSLCVYMVTGFWPLIAQSDWTPYSRPYAFMSGSDKIHLAESLTQECHSTSFREDAGGCVNFRVWTKRDKRKLKQAYGHSELVVQLQLPLDGWWARRNLRCLTSCRWPANRCPALFALTRMDIHK